VFARYITLALSFGIVAGPVCAQERDDLGTALTREYAIDLARNGRYDEALSLLESLREAAPDNQILLQDEIAALGWAERDVEVLDRVAELESVDQPLYVATAIAKSARNLREFAKAIQWYERAAALAPDAVDVRTGFAMTLAEDGDYAEADAQLDLLPPERQTETNVLLVRGYIRRLADDLIRALHAYDEILEQRPNDRDALRGKALVLRDLLLPVQALEIAESHPGVLRDDEIARLRVDDLALRLRLASQTLYPPETDGVVLDQTIADIDRHLAENHDRGAELALRYDRIAALAERERAAEAVEAFEELETPKEEIPAYALAAAGRAYLQIEQPQRALTVLELAAAKAPGEIEIQFALVYAYLDLNEYRRAMDVATSLREREPFVKSAPSSPIVKGNDYRLRAEVVSAIADASISELAAAQERLEMLLNEAPNNADLRHELASVYRGRGWLDRSLFEYRQVLTVEEDLIHAQVGRAYTQLDAQQFEAVGQTVEELNDEHADEIIVARLTERWEVHNRSELVVELSNGRSTGNTFGSNQTSLDAHWYTRPIRYSYRAFAHAHEARADFLEGRAERSAIGAGAEYRADRWTATGEILSDRDGGSAGVAGEFGWRMSDNWSFAGSLEFNSIRTQLRAHRQGIESDRTSFSTRYAVNESIDYGAGMTYSDLSDGNVSRTVFGDLHRRVMNRPRWQLELIAEAYASDNEKLDVPYFSPASDFSYLAGARHEWQLRRRYDRSVYQSSSLRVGQYDQSGFDAGRIWVLDYRVDVDLSPALSFQLGAERARRFYDGAAEFDTTVFLTFRARL
jgi:biofilm PGA synthesis protein PgaA